MAMPKAGVSLVVENDQQFKAALSEVNAGLKVNKQQMQLVTEQTREMDDRQAALKQRYEAAQQTLQSYRDKVQVLQQAYENSARREGEASKTTMQWRASLISAQTEVAKQENLLKELSDQQERTNKTTASLADVVNGLANALGISLPPGLQTAVDKLDGFYVTKSEHDWLERRFSNMTEKEKILFQGAMELEKPQEIGHVMRIASQLDCYDLFYGAGDEAALGKFVMESIECSSDAARPFLNAEHLGAAYHQSQNGAFCTGHYVRNIKLADPFVEEDPTLQPVAGDYAIRVKLASRSNMEGIWVGFPDSGEYIDSNHPDELLLGLDSLQAESLSECIALEVDCCLPQLTGILDQYDSASELVRHAIDFGYVWAEQGQGAPHWLDKWQAVLELEDKSEAKRS